MVFLVISALHVNGRIVDGGAVLISETGRVAASSYNLQLSFILGFLLYFIAIPRPWQQGRGGGGERGTGSDQCSNMPKCFNGRINTRPGFKYLADRPF